MRDPKAYLQRMQIDSPIAGEWLKLQQMYEKRLWHELTVELLTFVKNDYFKQKQGLVELYENFLADFEHRINMLSLVEICLIIGQEMKGITLNILTFVDSVEAIVLEEVVMTRVRFKASKESTVLCMTAIGVIKLQLNELDEAKKIIKEAQTLLDTIDGVTTVHGRFYDLSSNYSKVVGSYNDYYRDALRFLGCMNLDDLPAPELQKRAFNLSLAALLGSEIYNFGELLAHQVLEFLKGGEHSWLVDMLYAFNSGDIDKFQSLKVSWSEQPDLAANEHKLLQKITLLSLMELTFKRASNERSIPFKVIAETSRLPETEVELLVMKALSLGLIKGSIDEVDQLVHITWVQPRVLDKNQINSMKDLLGTWCEKVKASTFSVEDQVPELLVS